MKTIRTLLYRVFCSFCFFQSPNYRPKSHPTLPESELLDHPVLQHLVYDLASHLDVRNQFINSNPQPHPTE